MATNEEFLSTIKEGCIQGWRDHAVLASISGAQAILESNWGKSTLALKANNLFGIKGDYNGASLTVETKEFINKVFKIVDATFRKYPSWAESITDHSAFFTSTEWRKNNYAAVVGETNYKKAAQALSDAGYATDPDYPAKLIKLIETYDLQQWDDLRPTDVSATKEEEKPMSYEIDYRGINYSGRKTTANKYVIAHESGNPNNVGPNSLESEVKYMQGQASKGGAFTSHWVGSGGKIIQIAPVGYIQYGAGGIANPLSYAQVELARTNNAETFKKDYAAYVWLLRKLAAECGIPQSLDKTGNGIKTHLWVTNNLGNTDHTDPYAYLNSWGISNSQFATDIANGLSETVTVSNRISVSYERMVGKAGYSIDSKPWGESGAEYWGNTDDFLGKVVQVVEENGTGEYANTSLGWIDKKALIDVPVRVPVQYDATITAGGFSIDSKPWGEPGMENWGSTDAQLNKAFYFYEENASGEYANGVGLGWVDKRALTKGILAPAAPAVPEAPVEETKPAEVEQEKAVTASILFLPNGKNWTIYPENGPYTAGDVVSLEGPKEDGGLSFRILGDKGNNIVVVDLPNFGVVGLYYDADKGAVITKTYA